jgi:hypothetical protein
MTSTRSLDEIQADYIASMGRELGSAFFPLHRKLIELHILWQQYMQLYGASAETVLLLNRSAGLFFRVVQDELWDSVLLGISRLTDPPSSSGRKNLTIQSLPPLIDEAHLRTEIQALCSASVEQAAFAREHRNRRIAHQDHSYATDRTSHPLNGISRALVENMLDSLRKVMNRLDLHFRDSTMLYERFIDESGARLLISKLSKFEQLLSAAGAL